MIIIPDWFRRFDGRFEMYENGYGGYMMLHLVATIEGKIHHIRREYWWPNKPDFDGFFTECRDVIEGLIGERKPVQLEFDWSKSYDS